MSSVIIPRVLVITPPDLEGRRLPGPDPAWINLIFLPFPPGRKLQKAAPGLLCASWSRDRNVPGAGFVQSQGCPQLGKDRGHFQGRDRDVPWPSGLYPSEEGGFLQSWVVSRHGKGASRGWEYPGMSLSLQTELALAVRGQWQ